MLESADNLDAFNSKYAGFLIRVFMVFCFDYMSNIG
jgi:hypothetical protein